MSETPQAVLEKWLTSPGRRDERLDLEMERVREAIRAVLAEAAYQERATERDRQAILGLEAECATLRADFDALKSTDAEIMRDSERKTREIDALLAEVARLTELFNRRGETIAELRKTSLDAQERADKAEAALRGLLSTACSDVCAICGDGTYPARPGTIRPNEWWHDIGEVQIRCAGQRLRMLVATARPETITEALRDTAPAEGWKP